MRYDYYKKIAKILTKGNSEKAEKLFEYIIHAMDDDGGFLRTRYCYCNRTLSNRKMYDEVKTALVVLDKPFDFTKSTEYYEPGALENGMGTLLKMQLFCYDFSNEESFMQEAEVCGALGYPYPIRIDMEKETFEIMDKVVDYDRFLN